MEGNTIEGFEVPHGYYIDINAGPTMGRGHFKNSQYGDCYVTVYRSLDKRQSPPVEHVFIVGDFKIENSQDMRMGEFLREIRQGIERTISNDNISKTE